MTSIRECPPAGVGEGTNDGVAGGPTIIVAGFGRCGSSLTMQMLAAGGVRCAGEYPAFEDDRTGDAFDARVFVDHAGGAVKLLEPYRPEVTVPTGNYRCIWLDRDAAEQAKSYVKFAERVMGVRLSRADRKTLQASFSASRPVALRKVRAIGSTLVLSFESILADTKRSAARIAGHVGHSLDLAAMAGAVVPRTPRCLDGFLEVSQITRVPP